jgi:integrase
MAKITKRTVDALKPSTELAKPRKGGAMPRKRDALLWDDELPGFGVRCQPSGAKFYFLKYRTSGGRQRWLRLGQHSDEFTPDKARKRALREKAAVGDGADPSGARKSKRLEKTISELADRYFKEHVKAHNKPSTAVEVERIIEKRIKPALGRTKITELTRADVKAWHQGMSETPYEANRALAYCSKMMSLAAHEWELRTDNPCIGVKRFPERARERFFNDDELRALGEALSAAERDEKELPGFMLLVRLLATTGMRLGEALSLRWNDVDLTGRAIRLQDAKTGGRTVHLGAQAVTILSAVAEKDRKGFVVLGVDGEPLSIEAAEKAWGRLRTAAGVENARLHDLRHTVGTFAAMAGANAFAVRDLLGHKTLAMTGRYVQRAADMVRATADAVAGRVGAALGAGQGQTADVLQFDKKAPA